MKDFTDEKKETKIDFVALYEKHKRKGATTTLMSLFAMGLSGCFGSSTSTTTSAPLDSKVTGTVFDGLLEGATVYWDQNNNKLFDTDEAAYSATTNSSGQYSLTLPNSATGTPINVRFLTTADTIDKDTNAPTGANISFAAAPVTPIASNLPDVETVISPITDIVANLIDTGLTEAEAEQETLEALGLDVATVGGTDEIDLKTFNPFEENIVASSSLDEATVAKVAAVGAQIFSMVHTASEAASAAGLDKGEAVAAAINSLSDQIAENVDTDSSAAVVTIDLTDTTVIEKVIDSTTANATLDEKIKVELVKTSVSSAISKVSTAIGEITTVSGNDDLLYLTTVLSESVATSVQVGAAEDTLTLISEAEDTSAINVIAAASIKISGASISALSEDKAADASTGDISTSGTLSLTDPDANDTTTYQFKAETISGATGSLTINENGTWTYTVPSANVTTLNALQSIANKGAINTGLTASDATYASSGFEIVEQFKVTVQQVTDNAAAVDVELATGVSLGKVITINLIGANDAITLDSTQTDLVNVTIGQDSTLDSNDPTALSIATAHLFSDVDTSDTITYTMSGEPSGVSINASTGLITGTPANTQLGDYSVTVTASDAAGTQVSAAPFTITVTNTNDAPVASSDASANTATEDSVFSFDVSALFTDPDIANSHDSSDALTYSVAGNPSWLTLSGSTLSGTPENGDVTTSAVTLTITATDAYSAQATKDITVSVTNTNDAPTASVSDLGSIYDTETKVISINDLTTNDVDVGDTLTLTSVTLDTANAGSVVNNSDGTFTYTPVDGSTNVEDVTFSYIISDVASATATSTFTLDLTDAVSIGSFTEDGAGAVLDSSAYTVTGISVDAVSSGGNTAAEVAMFNSSTNTFTPAADYNGTVAFTITTTEEGDIPAYVSIIAVNDAPVAASTSTLSVTEDTAASGAISASDVDGDSLTYTYSAPSLGTLSATDKDYTYTPNANVNGSDSFTVTVSDGTEEVVQTVSVSIAAVNDAPVADSTSTLSVTEDTAASGTITATDVDGDTLSYTYSTPSKGAITAGSDGAYTYTPTANETGSDSFTVTVSDGTTNVVQTVSVNIAGVDDSPIITDPTLLNAVEDGSAVSGTISASDPEGDTLTYTYSTPIKGTLTSSGNSYTYTPKADANGSDRIEVIVSDGTSFSTKTVDVAIAAVNDSPVADSTSSLAVTEDTATSGTITATDVDGDTLTYTYSTPSKGAITAGSDGAYTYTPTANENGSDSFTVTVSDGTEEVVQTVDVTIAAVNDAITLNGSATPQADESIGHESNIPGSGTSMVTSANAFQLSSSQVSWIDYDPALSLDVENRVSITTTGSTATLGSDSVVLNLQNLTNAAGSTGDYKSPTLSFELLKVPTGSGSGTVNFNLIDGSDGTRETGERQVYLDVAVDWTGDGTTAQMSVPAQTVSGYYYNSSDSKVDFQIVNLDSDTISITESGPTYPSSLNVKLASIIDKLESVGSSSLLREGDFNLSVTTDLPLRDANDNSLTVFTTDIQIADGSPLTVYAQDATAYESETTSTATVYLNRAHTEDVVLNYSLSAGSSDTATAGSDFTAQTGSVTIAAGATSATITLPVLADTVSESLETFSLTLTGTSAGTLARDTAAVSIIDDETAAVSTTTSESFQLSSSQVSWIDYDPALSLDVENRVSITTTGSTATLGSDSVVLNLQNLTNAAGSTGDYKSPTLSFELLKVPTGSGSGTVNFNLIDGSDGTRETGERQVYLDVAVDWTGDGTTAQMSVPAQTVSGYYYNSSDSKVDFQIVNLDSDTISITESGPTYPSSLNVKLASIIDKLESVGSSSLLREGDFNLSVTTDLPLRDANDNSLTVFTTDIQIADGSPLTVYAQDATAYEGQSTPTAAIYLNRAHTEDVVLNYSLSAGSSDTATADGSGSDFTAQTGSVTIAAGATSATITLPVLADTVSESLETFSLTLTGTSAGTLIRDTATITIGDVGIGGATASLSIATAHLFSDVDTSDTITYTMSGEPTGVSINASTGLITGTPANTQLGDYSVTVTASDAAGTQVSAAPFTITVTNTNDAPVASSDASANTATEDSVFSFDVSALFTDPDIANSHDSSDALTYSVAGNPSWLTLSGSTLSGTPENGDVTTSAVTLTITATDAYGAYATKDITVSVTNTNDAPTASVSDLGLLRDTATKVISINDLTTNDVDVGDTVSLTHVILDTANAGSVVDNSDGTFTYTPVDGSTNVEDVTFSYIISDGASETATSTFTLDIVDSIPIGSFTEDGAGAVLDSSSFTVTGISVDAVSSGGNTAAEVAMFNSSTNTFTPAADYNGTVAFTITTTEEGELPAIVAVSAVNDAPVAASTSTLSVTEDTAASGAISASDVDGDSLTYTYSAPSLGTLSATDKDYTYTPNANVNGSDSFTIIVSDGTTSVEQNVSVTINAVDDRPVAESTSALSVTEDTAASGTITASEVDGQTLSYTYSTPSKGAITPGSDGAYTYTPTANENGSDSFTVTISDGTSTDVVQTVSVTINAVDDRPVAESTSALSVTEDTAASGTITASEVDGQTLSYTYSTPSKGAITPGSDGAYTYTPTANENGSDSFTVTISDGTSTDVVQTVSVNVAAVDDNPVAASASTLSVTEDVAASGTITASEVDGQTLSYTYSTPSKGAITAGNDGAYTYTPTANENGSDSFTVTISDGTSTDVVQTVSVSIADVPEPQVVTASVTNEGNVYTIDFNIDQTKVASSEITSITAFSLTMDGSGSATTTDGLVDTATFGTAYAVWNSLTTGDTGLDTYLYGGAINLQTNFSKNIFTSDDTWTSTFGNASAPMVSEATTWDLSGTDIIAEEYVGSTLSIGKLVVTLEDDVTNFDIVVSGSITGTTDPTADYVNETLQSFTIDVV